MSDNKLIESHSLNNFELRNGKKLTIGDIVKIDEKSEYYKYWKDEYIVTAIKWNRIEDVFDVTIEYINQENSSGSDGWTLEELILVRK